jgi:hypothetical protein
VIVASGWWLGRGRDALPRVRRCASIEHDGIEHETKCTRRQKLRIKQLRRFPDARRRTRRSASLPRHNRNVEQNCFCRWRLLLPRSSIFEFQCLGAGVSRPKCPGLYTTSPGYWAALLVCRLTETGKNRVWSTCQKPAITSRWIAFEIQCQLLADTKRNGMAGVRRGDCR